MIGALDLTALLGGVARQGVEETLPIGLAAVGETLTERAGLVNIGVEGVMLSGALAAAAAAPSGSIVLAAAAGLLAGAVCGTVFALFAVVLRCDQIVTGLGLNLVALGVTGVIHQSGVIPQSAGLAPTARLAGIDAFAAVTLALTVAAWLLLFRTTWGLTLLAVGEHPAAADAAGASVARVRAAAAIAGGALAGMGGAYLVITVAGRFHENMTEGRGFVALALVIFGRWSPLGALAAALFIGLLLALQQNLQPLLSADTIHTWYPLMLCAPYVATLAVLSLRRGSQQPPGALGQPFRRHGRT